MLKLKNKNGITLIALIITIIVMLILVGVTLTMALDENGIIAEAKKAKEKMEGAAQTETLQAAVLGAIGTDGKIDFSKLDGYEGTTETYRGKTTGTYVIDGKVYTIDENGNVTDITELAKYFLGEDLQGRYLVNLALVENGQEDENGIVGIDFTTGEFLCMQDPQNSNSKIHEQITLHIEDEVWDNVMAYVPSEKIEACFVIVVVEYKGDYYCFGTTIDDNTGVLSSIQGTLFKVFLGEDTLGKYVKYKGITWRVINDSGKVELLSADSLGSVQILWRNCDNAYSIILDECKEETGITENIRPINYPTDLLDADIDSKIEGILVTGEPYWLSGTGDNTTHPESGRDITEIHYIKSDGTFGREPMNSWWYDAGAWEILESGATYAVRPVVTLPAGSLDNVSGDGLTPETALQLD